MAAAFERGISTTFVDLLSVEADKEGWWRDVLADPKLAIGLRGNYLNVYWLGQSLFRVSLSGNGLKVTTHEKYLLDPALSGQVEMVDAAFQIEKLVQRGFLRRYENYGTLAKMKKTAGYYAGAEKRGVHEIAVRNSNIVDVEIAFPGIVSLDDGGEDRSAPRVDLAAVEDEGETARIVFWEAKTYRNGELRALESEIPVCRQLDIYKRYLADHRLQVEESYRKVAGNLAALAEMGWARPVSQTIMEIASGAKALTLGDHPKVGLVIFGFDAGQRDSSSWKPHLDKLSGQIAHIRAAGDPKNLRLPA